MESEGHFLENVLEGCTDISIICTDLEQNILYWSKGAEKMLGYSAKEVMGYKKANFLYPDDEDTSERVLDATQKVAQEKKAVTLDVEEITKEGIKIWVQITLSPRLDENGNFIGLFRLGKDINYQTQIENALRRSKERYNALVSNATDGIITINNKGIIRSFNPASEKLFGYTEREILGENVNILMPEPYKSKHNSFIARLIITGQKRVIGAVREFTGQKKNGEIFSLELSLSEMRVDKDWLFIGIIRDIKERVEAEAKLRQLHRKNELILASAGEGIFGLNPDGQITFINPAAASMLGYPEKKLVGQPVEILLYPKDLGFDRGQATESEKAIRASLKDGAAYRILDAVFWKQDDTCFPAEFTCTAVIEEENITGAVITFKDITQAKSIQLQLNHAQKMESIGQLAAGIAHEINTPMQFIGDNTRFLEDSFHQLFDTVKECERFINNCGAEPISENSIADLKACLQNNDIAYLSEEIPLAIKQSLDGVERVTNIVKAMKEFSHPGSEEKIPTDINKAIDTTLTVAKNEWKYLADIVKEFDPSLPLVPCFINDFNQVLLNTIVNAAHAIADVVQNKGDKGTITLTTRKIEDSIEIRIQDTGTGIPKNIREKIFDPFFTTKEVGKGTGQGLSIVHSVIVKKHQGSIGLETEEGQGTTFIFRLPINPQKKLGAVE